MKNEFISQLKDINIEINNEQYKQFEDYFRILIEWNQKMNLTAITDKEEVFFKHFYDSICLVKAIDIKDQTLLDVGSGAGFPSIPLKIIFPSLKITIVDALQKRITFLTELCKEINVEATLIHSRVEDLKVRNSFDIVTARAVANLRILSELCIPFVKKGGYFISLKGPKYEEEIELSKKALRLLNSEVESVINYSVYKNDRVLIKIRKTNESSDKYPRHYSKIKSRPL